jgi:hypothetical protein
MKRLGMPKIEKAAAERARWVIRTDLTLDDPLHRFICCTSTVYPICGLIQACGK